MNGADLQRQCPWETGLAENFGLNLILYRYVFVLTILLDLKRKQCYFITLYSTLRKIILTYWNTQYLTIKRKGLKGMLPLNLIGDSVMILKGKDLEHLFD